MTEELTKVSGYLDGGSEDYIDEHGRYYFYYMGGQNSRGLEKGVLYRGKLNDLVSPNQGDKVFGKFYLINKRYPQFNKQITQ